MKPPPGAHDEHHCVHWQPVIAVHPPSRLSGWRSCWLEISQLFALQVKKAIEKGNIDGAKIYAQNAIRKKTEALNYLRLASRLDAVVSRLDTQAKMNMINSSMSQIVRSLDRVSLPLSGLICLLPLSDRTS